MSVLLYYYSCTLLFYCTAVLCSELYSCKLVGVTGLAIYDTFFFLDGKRGRVVVIQQYHAQSVTINVRIAKLWIIYSGRDILYTYHNLTLGSFWTNFLGASPKCWSHMLSLGSHWINFESQNIDF